MPGISNVAVPLLFVGFAFVANAASYGAARPSGTWKNYLSSGGLQLQIPADWTAHAEKDGRVIVNGTSGEQATVWPVFIRDALDAQSAEAVARNLALKIWPSASFSSLPGTGQTIRLQGRDQRSAGMAIFSCVASNQGTSCIMHLGAAPADHYPQAQPAFAHIFQSVRIQGTPGDAASSGGGTGAPPLQYTQWRDPQEGAFIAEVPQRWQV